MVMKTTQAAMVMKFLITLSLNDRGHGSCTALTRGAAMMPETKEGRDNGSGDRGHDDVC